ncbi:putative oxidoreductase [Pelomonas saccharophila]|uniref:Oxidoreductase n=1 Tax=Roseateles saccharophilus TaxID=304 RepID=A0ABU1YQ66_ROSSA|nr:DoxX family membrane protein [Roseateles saccharophilus]MDR7271005.1 putative oxidoreductase [Roseateles saccharophilus]
MASSTSLGLLLLRLSLGLMYLAHAGLKLFVFSLPGTAQFFAGQGLPGVLAYVVFAAEAVGGALLLLGVYPRQIALALLPILLGAAWVHAPHGWVFTAPGGGWEYPVFLAAMSVVLWLAGDGAAALKRSARFTWSAA